MQLSRRKEIVNLIFKEGVVNNTELASRFKVNIATIRRDMKVLADEYEIHVSYGGASLKGFVGFQKEQPMDEKITQNMEQKCQVAQKAAALIENGDIIAINSGSTVSLILDYLPQNLTRLTLITLGFNVMEKAVKYPFIELIVPGGVYRHSSQVFGGTYAEKMLEGLVIDKAFLGVNSIDSEYGWTHPIMAEVEMNKTLLKNARNRYLVADTTKFDKVSLAKIADMDEFDGFIVDDKIPKHYLEFAEMNTIKIY